MAESAPQDGPQKSFLSSCADIAIYGGAAGGGKTWALLAEASRGISKPEYRGVIFRKTFAQVQNAGGLWDESVEMYQDFRGDPLGRRMWRFPSGSSIIFSHMQHEKHRYDWQGSQIPFIGFDEVTHFSWKQFSYMLSRNRSAHGKITPYIRATCNPDPDSFVADLIEWWIDQDSGFPIASRSGVIRYFYSLGDTLIWGDSMEELIASHGERFTTPDGQIIKPKSLTFISSSVYDNKILLEKNPEYLSSLHAMPKVERERLLKGNWKIRDSAGNYFRREYFEVFVRDIQRYQKKARGWDLASTEPSASSPDPDYTAGVLLGKRKDNRGFSILDIVRDQLSPAKVEALILSTARLDGKEVTQCFFIDPAQAGKSQKLTITRLLQGFKVKFIPTTKGKVEMASPVSAQAEAGNIDMQKALWNREFIAEAEAFPDGSHDDMVDGLSRAFIELTQSNTISSVKSVRS